MLLAAIGANTWLGRSTASSAAAVRAGLTGFVQHPLVVDSVGEPVRVAAAPWLDFDLQGHERLLALPAERPGLPRAWSRACKEACILEPDLQSGPRVSLVWHSALPCHFKVQKLDRTIVTLKADRSLGEARFDDRDLVLA